MIQSRSKRRTALILLIAAFALLMGNVYPTAPVTAAPAGCDRTATGKRPVRLCSVTKLSGKSTGYARVLVTKKTRVTSRAFKVTSADRFAGFLFKDEAESGGEDPVLGGRFRPAGGDGQFVCCLNRILKPGIYRLYLISKGPASITIDLPKLPRGTTSVTPKTITGASIHRTSAGAVSQNVSQYYGAGVTDSTESDKGLAFVGLWVRHKVHVATAHGTCLYFGAAPAEAFAPGCPWWGIAPMTVGGDSAGVAPSAEGASVGIYSMTWTLPRGTYSLGGYAASGGTADDVAMLALLLDLE